MLSRSLRLAGTIMSVSFSLLLAATAAHSDTSTVQQALADIGCYDGTINGQSSLKVRTGIRCFQKSQNLSPTGELTAQQEDSLLALAETGFQVPDQTPEIATTTPSAPVQPSRDDPQADNSPPAVSPPVQSEPDAVSRRVQTAAEQSPECGDFFQWQEPYVAEFPGAPDYRRQIGFLARSGGKVQPIGRLFEDENIRRMRGFQRMSTPRNEAWHEAVESCLRSIFGFRTALYTEYASLASVLHQYSAEHYGTRGRGGAGILSVKPSLIGIEEFRADVPVFFQEIRNVDIDSITGRELQQLQRRYNDFESSLWPSSVVDLKAALDDLTAAVRQRETAQREQNEQFAIANLSADQELCLSFVDPDEPTLPDDLVGTYDLPDEADAAVARAACERAIREDEENPHLRVANGRLNLAMSHDAIARTNFARAASFGSVAAQAYLADLETDTIKAMELYELAAKGGFKPAEEAALLLSEYTVDLQRIEAEELAEAERLVEQCDLLAAHPHDADKPQEILGVADIDIQFEQSFEACIAAINAAPNHTRSVFHLGRILSLVDELALDAEPYLVAAHDAGYAPATYYLAGLKDRREEIELLESVADRFQVADEELQRIIRYPEQVSLTNIFRDPARISSGSSANNLVSKSFSVGACTNEIFAQVRDDKVFQSGVVELLAGGAYAVCLMDSNMCGAWNRFNEVVRQDARNICLREQSSFNEYYPQCLEPYWHEQNAAALEDAPNFAKQLVSFYHAQADDFEAKSLGFDASVGELTDLAAILYLAENGLKIAGLSATDLDDQNMLSDSVDPEIRDLITDLKSSKKYEIALNMIPREFLCDA